MNEQLIKLASIKSEVSDYSHGEFANRIVEGFEREWLVRHEEYESEAEVRLLGDLLYEVFGDVGDGHYDIGIATTKDEYCRRLLLVTIREVHNHECHYQYLYKLEDNKHQVRVPREVYENHRNTSDFWFHIFNLVDQLQEKDNDRKKIDKGKVYQYK